MSSVRVRPAPARRPEDGRLPDPAEVGRAAYLHAVADATRAVGNVVHNVHVTVEKPRWFGRPSEFECLGCGQEPRHIVPGYAPMCDAAFMAWGMTVVPRPLLWSVPARREPVPVVPHNPWGPR